MVFSNCPSTSLFFLYNTSLTGGHRRVPYAAEHLSNFLRISLLNAGFVVNVSGQVELGQGYVDIDPAVQSIDRPVYDDKNIQQQGL